MKFKLPGILKSMICNKAWKSNSDMKLLIEVNKYFNKNKWNEHFIRKYSENLKNTEINYSDNKYDFLKLSKDADYIFCFGINDKAVFRNLRHIYVANAGYEIKDDVLLPENTIISDCKGIASTAVSEFCLMAFFMLKNGLYNINKLYFDKCWEQDNFLSYNYSDYRNFKVGIAGLGNIGSKTAELFRLNGIFVAGYDLNEAKANIVDKYFDNLNEFLEYIDVLILALPHTKFTTNLITYNELEKLGRESFLINISRGEILHELGLYNALKNKVIKCALVDTFSNEPLTKYSHFWDVQNLIITPHISGNINKFIPEIINDFVLKTGIVNKAV